MSQRFLVAISFTMMCVCLFVGWIAWSASAANRKTNQYLSEQLAAADQNNADGHHSHEWVPCTLRLTNEQGQSVPDGFSVELTAPPHLNDSKSVDFKRATVQASNDGVVDLGLLRRRVYLAAVTSPWNEQTYVEVDTRVANSIDTSLACPDAPLQIAPVTLDVDWPEDLEERGFGLCFHFTQDSPHRTRLNGNSWTNCNARHFQLIVSSDGKFVRKNGDKLAAVFQHTHYGGPNGGSLHTNHLKEDSSIALDEQASLWEGKYRMICMFVLPNTPVINSLDELPPQSLAQAVFYTPNASVPNKQPSRLDIQGKVPEFVIRAGENNAWSVSVPAEFVELLRNQTST